MGDAARDRELPQRVQGRSVEPERLVEQAWLVTPELAIKPEPAKMPPNHQPAPAAARPEPSVSSKPPGPPERSRANAIERPARRRLTLARMVTSALVVIAAGSLAAAVITSHAAKAPGPDDAASAALNSRELAALNRQELKARDLAAAWVVQQVSHTAVVSCDPKMCAALASARFPRRNLRVLGSDSPYPLTSAVVVETAAVRALFGSSLDNEWAPAVLAAFGSGEAEITIRVIAPDGAAAYLAALAADLTERKAAGAELLQTNGITVSATAGKQLAAGQVDSRLLLAIAFLVTNEPIAIVRFGNIGSGGTADLPLRVAYLAESGQAAHLTSSAYVRSIVADLGKVPVPANSASSRTVRFSGGQPVLRIEFPAPSPLGLLGPQGSR
jgi:hypothetical protein